MRAISILLQRIIFCRAIKVKSHWNQKLLVKKRRSRSCRRSFDIIILKMSIIEQRMKIYIKFMARIKMRRKKNRKNQNLRCNQISKIMKVMKKMTIPLIIKNNKYSGKENTWIWKIKVEKIILRVKKKFHGEMRHKKEEAEGLILYIQYEIFKKLYNIYSFKILYKLFMLKEEVILENYAKVSRKEHQVLYTKLSK